MRRKAEEQEHAMKGTKNKKKGSSKELKHNLGVQVVIGKEMREPSTEGGPEGNRVKKGNEVNCLATEGGVGRGS